MALRRIDTSPHAPQSASSRTRRGKLLHGVDLSTLVWAIPLAIAGAYLVVFVVQLPRNIAYLGWDASVASAFVMPETLVRTGTGGLTVMGSTGQWVALWFGLLTAGLPLHRQLWGLAPTLLFVATAFTVGWSVAQVAGRRAGAFAVLIGLVASPLALLFLMAPFSHNAVYPCTALLGAYLIWLTRGARRRRLISLAVPPALGVVVGTCLASDVLLAATAVIPLALTAILAAVRRERRSRLVSLSALTTVAVAVPVAKLTSTTMGSLGYVTLPTPIKIAALSELPARTHLLFDGLKELFNGYLDGAQGSGPLHTQLGIASDIVMSAALLTLIAVGTRATFDFISSGLRRNATQTPAQLARSLHIVYWTISAACACGAFWIAGEGPITTHYSYYDSVVFSVAAVIPLLLSTASPLRWLIPAGASVFFAAGLLGLSANHLDVSPTVERAAANVEKIARANHVQVGYGDWADAAGLTWSTHNRVAVRPVIECLSRQGIALCPGFQAFVPSWYVPQPRHTFLLVEANGVDLGSLPEGLGKPLAAYTFGVMRMYIYPYDIAPRASARRRVSAAHGAHVVPAAAGLDDVLRPIARFVIDPPDVLADHAQREQLDAAEEGHRDHDRRVTDGEWNAAQLQAEVDERDGERQPREQHADERDQLQRVAREADDAVQPDHAAIPGSGCTCSCRRHADRGRRGRSPVRSRPGRRARAGSRGPPSARRRCRRPGGS